MADDKKNTQKKEDALSAAASESAQGLMIERISVSDESELDKFEFEESVDAISDAMDPGIQVRRFTDPNDPEKTLSYAVRQLTAAEHSEIFETVFDTSILASALKMNEEDINEETLREAAIENMKTKSDDTQLVKQARAIFKSTLRPKQTSVEAILKLPLSFQYELYDACTLVALKVWRFQ